MRHTLATKLFSATCVLASSWAAQAADLYTAPLTSGASASLYCHVANVSEKTLVVTVENFDLAGNLIDFDDFTIPPGVSVELGGGVGFPVRCHFGFRGNKQDVRAVGILREAAGIPIATALAE